MTKFMQKGSQILPPNQHYAILLMGGSGERFGSLLPKQFQHIASKPIYLYPLQTLAASALFSKIILVCHPEWISLVEQQLKQFLNPRDQSLVKIVEGGSSRQASSLAGILSCPPETTWILIHDAVRPFLSQQILKEHALALKTSEAVDTCIPSTDTIVDLHPDGSIEKIAPRTLRWQGQTPQSFHYKTLLKAHRETSKKEASDDCQLVLDLGIPVTIVKGSKKNFKITSALDLQLANISVHQPDEL